MCTVTWTAEPDRYSLFCNRDELRTRGLAHPPTTQLAADQRFLAPTDGDAGGTWIAVNSRGLSLCLLNDYGSPVPAHTFPFVSRGLLVQELIRSADLSQLEGFWAEANLQRYRPFRLLALAPGQEALLLGWDGERASVDGESVTPPLCSSSFDDAGAGRARSELFQKTLDNSGVEPRRRQLLFHQSHRPERGPYSVCMHRPDAVTVSLTVVEVDPVSVSMAYAQGAPCSAPLEHLTVLDRVS